MEDKEKIIEIFQKGSIKEIIDALWDVYEGRLTIMDEDGVEGLDKAKQKNIASYEVELACLTFNYNTLPECVYHLINYFSGRIKKKDLLSIKFCAS